MDTSNSKLEKIDGLINEYLKEKRIEKELTIQKLSKISGVSSSHISRIEGDKRKPTHKILKKLSLALEIDYIDLLRKADYLYDNKNTGIKDFKEILFLNEHTYKDKVINQQVKHKIIQLLEKEIK